MKIDRLTLEVGQSLKVVADFSLEAGQVTVLSAPSGSGKTSLLEYLAGNRSGIKKISGTVTHEGRPWEDRPLDQLGIGLVTQDRTLFTHLSVRENLEVVLNWRKAIPGADFEELVKKFGLSELLDRSVDRLSGGEKTRVALLRALLKRPTFLFLDEPFNGLDQGSKSAIISVLKQFIKEQEVACLLITHLSDEQAQMEGKLLTTAIVNKITTFS